MSEIRVRSKIDGVEDRRDPETDRVVTLPPNVTREPRRYGGALLGT